MNSDVEVYNQRPGDFSAKIEVAAIYVLVNDKILLLQLADSKEESGSWGVPCGKLETKEVPVHAARRELFEETGIHIVSDDAIRYLQPLYIRKPHIEYIYHISEIRLDDFPSVSLSQEHGAYIWVSIEDAKALPLMKGGKQALEAYERLFVW